MSYTPTKWETDEPTGLQYRFVDDDGNPIFEYIIDDRHHSFTMCKVDPAFHGWLKEVILRQVKEIRDRAFKLGAEAVKNPILDVLGVK